MIKWNRFDTDRKSEGAIFTHCISFTGPLSGPDLGLQESSPFQRHLPFKVHIPPTVKFLPKLAQVVKSAHLKHFWNRTCRRFLVIQDLSSKFMTSCKGFVLKFSMEKIRLK